MSFAEQLARVPAADVAARIEAATPDDVRRALVAETLGPDGLAALLSPAAEGFLGEMAQRARRLTRQHFGRTVQLYAPMYVSNACENGCVYCGFSARNATDRRTLSLDEAVREAEQVRSLGFRHVLLVSGEVARFGPSELLEVVRAIRPMFDSVSIEVFPMADDDYEHMVEAGVDGLTVFQETYDRDVYAEMHPRGRKRDFDWRLGSPERGAAAGMRRVGIGFLMGLADPRVDAFHTALHGAYLARRHWRAQVCVSFPRIREAEGGFQPTSPVTDRMLVQTVLATRLFLPQAGLVLSTRESPRLRDALMPYGITQMSAGSRTEPGGYTEPGGATGQFSVGDERTADEVCDALRAAGFDPVWKDWDPAFVEEARA